METKAWYRSKTIWGSILMLVSILLTQFTGVELTGEDQESASNMLVGIAEGAGTLVGFVLVIVGRVKAKKGIGAPGDTAKKLGVLLALGALCITPLQGCATLQSAMTSAAQVDLKNAEASRQVAKDLLSTWRLNSGFIRGAMGPKIAELPAQAVDAMQELDALSRKTDLDDYDLGYSLGARVRMLSTIIQETVKMYAPEALKYVPGLLSL